MKMEDALKNLLNSIAQEEESLSKMLDTENKKMLHILDEYKRNKLSIQDTKDITKSVNETIVNMIRLQMLLQCKTDSIKELLPTTTATSISSNTTTSTKSTTTTTTEPKFTTTITKTDTITCTTSTSTTTTSYKKEKDKMVWTYSFNKNK